MPIRPPEQDYLRESLKLRYHGCNHLTVPEPRREPMKYQAPNHIVSMVLRGGRVETRFEGDREWRPARTPGTVCFLPAYRRREVRILPERPGVAVEAAWGSLTCTVYGNIDFFSFWDVPFLFSPEIAIRLAGVLTELTTRQPVTESWLERAILEQRYIGDLLDLILQDSTMKPDSWKRIGAYRLLEPAMQCLEGDIRKAWSVDDLARACCLSRSQFHHNFKQVIGATPHEYQRQLRIREAQRLLIATEMGVGEIGAAVGMDSPYHFSQSFKQMVGLSPNHFRRQQRHSAAANQL